MKQLLILLLILTLSFSPKLTAQATGAGTGPTFNNIAASTAGDIPRLGLEALYAPVSLTLNDGSRYYTPATNLIKWSGDMTGTGWVADNATKTASLITATSANGGVYQAWADTAGTKYTLFAYLKAGTETAPKLQYTDQGSYSLSSTYDLATGTVSTIGTMVAMGDGWYACARPVASSGSDSNDLFQIIVPTSGATVYAKNMAVIPGTWTAAEAALLYEATTDRQVITDFSGSGNTAYLGADGSSATDDPTLAVTSRNEAIPGTTEDLEHTSWTESDAAAGSATTFTPSAADGQITQSFTGVSGAKYRVSATIASAGNTDLEWTLDGVETAVAVTASPARYSIVYTGDGSAAAIGLRDPAASGYGAITFTEFQVERVPSASSTATAYVSPAEPTVQGWSFDGVDDQIDASPWPIGAQGTVLAVVKPNNLSGTGAIVSQTTGGGLGGPINWNLNADELPRVDLGDGTTHSNISASASVPIGVYSIIALTWNGTAVVHYLNGATNGSGTGSVTPANGGTDAKIGAKATGGGQFFSGTLTTPAVYSRALSASEVARATRELARRLSEQGICVELSDGWQGSCTP